MLTLTDCPSFLFQDGGMSHRVYRSGPLGRCSILLLQELPGLTPESMQLIERLNSDGYTVYVPHLFGEPGAPAAIAGNVANICVRREIYLLDRRRSAPFTEWLRALCRRMQEESNGPVGAIGQCLTGGFVIPLMIDGACAAPVAAQPGHLGKFWRSQWKSDLGIAPEDEVRAIASSKQQEIPLLAMRFTRDPMCPRQRFDAMEEKFGPRFERLELQSPRRGMRSLPAHSVLTIDYDPAPGSDTRKAYETVLQYFQKHLVDKRAESAAGRA